MDKLSLHVLSGTDNRGQQLYDYLFTHIDTTLHNSSLEMNGYKGYSEIILGRSKPHTNKSAKGKAEWLEAVTMTLADYVLDHHEEELLLKWIKQERQYFGPEAQEILGYCKQLMNEEDELGSTKHQHHGRTRRRKLLSQDLNGFLKEHPVLNIDGFLQFRISKYGAELRELIEYAMDEYLMDQQYKEFISLLRYFVYIQDSKIPEAHLMHKGGHEFLLLNEHMKPIDTEQLDTSFKVEFLDKDYNLEDLIVSTLITIAPERIYIHTREPELPVIHTISQIFEDRSEICEYCRLCKPILGDMSQQDKLSP